MFVPVVDLNNKPLMPTKPSRARRWVKERKATPFFKRGVFCVRLNIKPSAREYARMQNRQTANLGHSIRGVGELLKLSFPLRLESLGFWL